MKIKTTIVLFLVIAVLIFNGCKSTQINPSFDGFVYNENFISTLEFMNDDRQTQYNRDGSITLFRFRNILVRIMPMTVSRSSRGALDRSPEEFNNLINQLEADVNANPRDFDSYIMLAGLLIDRGGPGDAERAVRFSDQALSIRINDPDALYARGVAYSEIDDAPSRARAINDLENVLQANLQSMKGVYYVMGMVYYKDGKINEAISAFEKVKTIDPEFVDTDEILEVLYNRRN